MLLVVVLLFILCMLLCRCGCDVTDVVSGTMVADGVVVRIAGGCVVGDVVVDWRWCYCCCYC